MGDIKAKPSLGELIETGLNLGYVAPGALATIHILQNKTGL